MGWKSDLTVTSQVSSSWNHILTSQWFHCVTSPCEEFVRSLWDHSEVKLLMGLSFMFTYNVPRIIDYSHWCHYKLFVPFLPIWHGLTSADAFFFKSMQFYVFLVFAKSSTTSVYGIFLILFSLCFMIRFWNITLFEFLCKC